MSGHTPGPWQWVDRGGWFALLAANGTRVADDGSAADEYGRKIDPEDKGESGANARLIAAAPELLAALVELVESNGEHGLKEARDAIAKATGEGA